MNIYPDWLGELTGATVERYIAVDLVAGVLEDELDAVLEDSELAGAIDDQVEAVLEEGVDGMLEDEALHGED